jgi:protocatechuate 3,4-dioxygenase alpha subunit
MVADSMLEIWQADAQGRFSDPQDARALPNSTFKGFGRCGTDKNAGSVPDPAGRPQASYLGLAVFARGTLLQLYTRIYFDDEACNASDPVLALVPLDRRATLIAKRKSGSGNAAYALDFHLQGDDETVFFEV